VRLELPCPLTARTWALCTRDYFTPSLVGAVGAGQEVHIVLASYLVGLPSRPLSPPSRGVLLSNESRSLGFSLATRLVAASQSLARVRDYPKVARLSKQSSYTHLVDEGRSLHRLLGCFVPRGQHDLALGAPSGGPLGALITILSFRAVHSLLLTTHAILRGAEGEKGNTLDPPQYV